MPEPTPSPRPGGPEPGVVLNPPGSSRPSPPATGDPSTTADPRSPSTPSRGPSPSPSLKAAAADPSPPATVSGEDSEDFYDEEPSSGSTTAETSSPTSTEPPPWKRPPPLVDPRLFAADIAQAVGALGQAANDKFGPPGSDAWLTTPEEEHGVGDPAARMLARRVPDVLAKVIGSGPDAEDAVQAAITLARYAVRQFRLRMELRRQRRAAASPVDAQLNGDPL